MNNTENQLPEITIFTLDLNNHLQKPIQKLCVDSWYRWKENNSQIKDIKLFNRDSKEFQDFWKEFEHRKYDNCAYLAQVADAFRLYILSTYPNHLWFDSDVYVQDVTFKWKDKFIFSENWHCLYNGSNTSFYKDVFNIFLTEDVSRLRDELICKKYALSTKTFDNYADGDFIFHLCQVDNSSDFLFVIYNESIYDMILPIIQSWDDIRQKLKNKLSSISSDQYEYAFYENLFYLWERYAPKIKLLKLNKKDPFGEYMSEELFYKLINQTSDIYFNRIYSLDDEIKFKQNYIKFKSLSEKLNKLFEAVNINFGNIDINKIINWARQTSILPSYTKLSNIQLKEKYSFFNLRNVLSEDELFNLLDYLFNSL